jgi:putative hydrolase of HD superfamily
MRSLAQFIFELGQLKRIRHEGWRTAGVESPETVAAHNARAIQIGFILAKLEGYAKPEEVVTIVAFHDIGECRIGDLHKVAQRYVEGNEERAVEDQTKPLGEIGQEILDYWKQIEHLSTTAGIIAKDADLLEQLVTAKEYLEIGYSSCQDWIDNIQKVLRTNSAKKLAEEIVQTNSTDWWAGLKKL